MEQLVADHPYFSAARLLLARKVFQKTGDLQSPAVKKALLYTNQHHYAYQVISEEQILQEVVNRVSPALPEDTLPVETITAPDAVADDTTSVVEEIAATISLPVVEDRIPIAIPEDALPAAPLSEVTAVEAAAPVLTVADSPIPVTIHDEVVPVDMSANVVEEIAATTALPVVEDRIPVVIPEDALPESHHTESTPTVSIADEEIPHFAAATEDVTENATAPAAAVITALPETPAPAPAPEEALPIKIFPLTTATEETELIFQPLYTDDYFAYKRLKNPEEADELNAKGAAEMKSFTSWLRQMKDNFVGKTSKDWYHQQLHRIYEEDDEPEVSETVEKMAMDSIVFNNDIVSETLAEIWVRQQQYGNAIKIYQKLSLLNPDKNAYFAQKILELKSQTDKKNKQ